jgi:hypothetical protein
VRTTVTLYEDVAAALHAAARERGVSFKEALNSAVRAGLSATPAQTPSFRIPTRALGLRPGIDLDRALRLAGEDEDEESVDKVELRSPVLTADPAWSGVDVGLEVRQGR